MKVFTPLEKIHSKRLSHITRQKFSLTGFTLIELMVSVAIFTIVMVVALGALLSMVESDRKAQTLKTITNNLHFALDSMSRSIRTGDSYNCGSPSGGDCSFASGEPEGGSVFYFRAIDGNIWGYRWNSAGCPNTFGCIERSQNGGSSWAAITAPEVVVQHPTYPSGPLGGSGLTFFLVGSAAGNTTQPKVTVLLRGYVQVSAALRSNFNLQTTITQRIYDQ